MATVIGSVKNQYAEIRSTGVLDTALNEYIISSTDNADGWQSVEDSNQLILDILFTKGSLTNIVFKVWYSQDGTNYTQATMSTPLNGAADLEVLSATFTANFVGQWKFDVKTRYIKVTWQATGTVTSSDLILLATLGIVPISA